MPWWDSGGVSAGSNWWQKKPVVNPQTNTDEYSATEPLPFMAQARDSYGLPYYGHGLQGWAKKTFAKVFDPKFTLPKPTKQQAEMVMTGAEKIEDQLNDRLGWDEWIGKWTGITAQDVGTAGASANVAVNTKTEIDPETGESKLVNTQGLEKLGNIVKTEASTLPRIASEAVWTGLNVLGTLDVVSRKVQSFNAAQNEIGDTSSILPDITHADEVLQEMFPDSEIAQRTGKILDALMDLQAGVATYNLIRTISAGEDISQKWKTVEDYSRASDMIYTMYWDEAKKEEYFQRLKSGDNPDLIARDLENPWVELGGSILGDPSTYLGMSIPGKFFKGSTDVKILGKTIFKLPWEEVGKIPSLTELMGLKSIGSSRLLNAGSLFNEPATKALGVALESMGKVGDEAQAVQQVDKVLKATSEAVQDLSKTYGVFVPDASAKADVMKKTVQTVFGAMASRFRSLDDVAETFQAFRNLKSENPVVAMKAIDDLKEMYGMLPFSTGGFQAMEFMNRLQDSIKIGDEVEKAGGDLARLTESLTGKVNNVVEDMFPSVNDMQKAYETSKTAESAVKMSARDKFLAESYKKLPTPVVWATSAFNSIADNKAYQGLQKFFAGVYMGMSPAYALRNLQSNTFHIWHDLGTKAAVEAATTGAEVFVKSTAGKVAKNEDWVGGIIAREEAAIEKMLGGALPYTAEKGIGQAGEAGAGFIGVGQDIEKSSSLVIVRNVVEREMNKALRYGGLPALDNINPEDGKRILQLTLENFGDAPAAIKQWRTEKATGAFDVFRHLELDPTFADWLKKSSLYDELDGIRKTAQTNIEFADQMDAFIQKVKNIAEEVKKEPSFVSMDNPIGETVAYIEKAFGTADRPDINAFRAKTELWNQLRTQFSKNARELKSELDRMLTSELSQRFNDQFSDLEETLQKGVESIRNLSESTYDGIYAQSKKGVPPSELIDKAQAMLFDVENGKTVLKRVSMKSFYPDVDWGGMTNKEFNNRLWTWVKETQNSFWRGYNQDYLVAQDIILEQMAQAAGMTLDDLKMKHFGSAENPKLKRITDLSAQIAEWENYLDPETLRNFGTNVPEGTKLSQMELSGIDNWKGGQSHLFNAVNKDRAVAGLEKYAVVGDVPFSEALKSLKKRTAPVPPYVETTAPSVARQLFQNLQGGALQALEEFKTGTLSRWGEKVSLDADISDETEKVLSQYVKETGKRMVTARANAIAVANETRNFILHDYNKTYLDKFLGLMLQYHYWPSRTYARWLERAVDIPGVLSAYAKYHGTMEKVHADSPEWWRYNIPLPKIPGTDTGSPMFFNLEATLNPLNGLTGVDFNDPNKRVDWLSSAVDDMGKMGFNIATPLQWLMAFHLYKKGEDDAARRWVGNLIPVSQTLKAALNLANDKLGIDLMPDISALPGTKYGDFDPFKNIFQGGLDSNEEKRVGRAMAAMIQEGTITNEQAQEALVNRGGDIWDMAVRRSINERAPGQLASYFLGVGFKARTESDMQVDQFYGEYSKLLAMREMISPDDYKKSYDQLMSKYSFGQTVLLSKRGGDDRDAGYAFSVFSRVPPGQATEIYNALGINDLVSKLYETKGDFSRWTPTDKDRLMSAVLDMGVAYSIPDDATKQEWNEAKTIYADVKKEIANSYGEDIWNVINTYFDLVDTNKDEANLFKAQHPEISQVFQIQNEAKISNPLLYKYYGSLDTIESYYDGKTRAYLADKYGDDITQKQAEYFNIKVESEAKAKSYLRQHPELKKYWTEKNQLDEQANQKIIKTAGTLPNEEVNPGLRDDFSPQNQTQELLSEFAGQQVPSWAELSATMSTPLQQRVIAYWESGGEEQLSNSAIKELDYLARTQGYYNSDDLLRQAGYSLLTGNTAGGGGNWWEQ